MANRWSGARQSIIDTARMLIVSEGCTYGISGLEQEEKAATVAGLLYKDTFHFGKGSSVSGCLM